LENLRLSKIFRFIEKQKVAVANQKQKPALANFIISIQLKKGSTRFS